MLLLCCIAVVYGVFNKLHVCCMFRPRHPIPSLLLFRKGGFKGYSSNMLRAMGLARRNTVFSHVTTTSTSLYSQTCGTDTRLM